jgi:RNA polymerase sigma-70 factor (ECF subfamily)
MPTGNADTDPIRPEDHSDEDLLLAYRETGEPELFKLLVRRYERELYNYLRRYLADAVMAEDAFQGTFLQVHLKSDQFQEGRRVRPWLYTIATNQAIDAQRRNKRHQLVSLDRSGSQDQEVGTLVDLLVSAEPDPRDCSDTQELRAALQRALSELPDCFREVVMLVYFQGLKYREAAEVLSIPVCTVKSRLHSALLKLSEALHRPQTD